MLRNTVRSADERSAMDYFEEAKAITREFFPAIQGGRLQCRYCGCPCCWDRDGLCGSCREEVKDGFFDRVMPYTKELLCPPKS